MRNQSKHSVTIFGLQLKQCELHKPERDQVGNHCPSHPPRGDVTLVVSICEDVIT